MSRQDEAPDEVLSALFNNGAFSEAASSAHRLLQMGSPETGITTRMVAAATGRPDSVIRPVMMRLVRSGLLTPSSRPRTPRGPQYFIRDRPDRWEALMALIANVTGVPVQTYDLDSGADAGEPRSER